ncbi:MAG: hypothetical protein SH850_05875 [Planctomycetaceae bacterium]|nr:hypothetical protein [Planctomycetaceae bacterium]
MKKLVPILMAFASVAWLIAAVAGPILRGEPLNYTFLIFAIVFFNSAVLFFAIGRKSGGGSGPPSA